MRLFLAGPLGEAAQAEVQTAVDTVRRAAAQVRWVPSGQLHLTVAFLGEVRPSELPPLLGALEPLGSRHRRMELVLRGAGCFGRPRQPSILFAEVAGDRERLQALAADARAVLATRSGPGPAPSTEPFHPHLTLARARARHGDAALAVCQRALRDRFLASFTLDRLVLFHSETRPTGAVHTRLAEFPLGGASSAEA